MSYEALMMDALDGVISAADRAKLEAYLNQHPAERAAFQQMMAVDTALRNAPIASLPHDFSQTVITRARKVSIARPMQRRNLALFIATNSMLVSLVWLFGFAMLVVLGALLLQQPIFHPVLAFVRGVYTYLADVFDVLKFASRVLIAQPVVWIAALLGTALVVTWLSVMAKVLMPRPARALAVAQL